MRDTVLVVLVVVSLAASGIALSQALRKPEAPPAPPQIGRYQLVHVHTNTMTY